MKSKKKLLIITTAVIAVILTVSVIVITAKVSDGNESNDNRKTEALSSEAKASETEESVETEKEEQYWLITDKKTGITTSSPGWTTEEDYNGTAWSDAATEDMSYVWHYVAEGDNIIVEPCIWYEYKAANESTEDTGKEDLVVDNDIEDNKPSSGNENKPSSSTSGNENKPSSSTSGNGNKPSSGSSNKPSAETPSTPSTEAPSTQTPATETPTTEAATTETPTTEQVHTHTWKEVWGKKQVFDYGANVCIYCGLVMRDYTSEQLVAHCSSCGGIWTEEDLAGADPFIIKAQLGQPKGSNYTYKEFYKSVDAIIYYECECGSVKPAN